MLSGRTERGCVVPRKVTVRFIAKAIQIRSYDRQEISLKDLPNLWGARREGKFDDFMVLISTEVMLRQRLSVRDSASSHPG